MNLFQASSSILKYGLLLLLAGVIAACSSSQYAPGQDLGYSVQRLAPIAKAAPKSYQVKPGDTMFAIAWRFDWDYKELARVNGIKSPYTIYVGQAIYFDKALITQNDEKNQSYFFMILNSSNFCLSKLFKISKTLTFKIGC